MKKLRIKPITISIIVVLVLIVTTGTIFTYSLISGKSEVTIEAGEEISYTLRSNATDYQKELFKELEVAIQADKETDNYGYDVSAAIVKNYIVDFYTWSNKRGSYDIGGMQYVYGSIIQNVYEQARAYFYRDLSYYIETYKSENLLEVDSVNIKYVNNEGAYVIDGQTYQSYYISVSWTYKDNMEFSPSTFQNAAYFSVIYKDGSYQIYRYYEG